MSKTGIIFGAVAIGVIAAIIAAYSFSSSESESMDLDVIRTHGSISTAMGSPILGDADAPITIVEFGDYQCHQCKNWFENTKPALFQDYIDTGRVNLVFVDMAFLGRDSPKAAQATYCAEEQGAYWQYHDLLYQYQEQIDDGWANSERLRAFAFNLGLDIELFNSCLDSNKYQKRVENNIAEARELGVSGTPTFIIISSNGEEQKLVGAQPYSVFQNVINSMI